MLAPTKHRPCLWVQEEPPDVLSNPLSVQPTRNIMADVKIFHTLALSFVCDKYYLILD